MPRTRGGLWTGGPGGAQRGGLGSIASSSSSATCGRLTDSATAPRSSSRRRCTSAWRACTARWPRSSIRTSRSSAISAKRRSGCGTRGEHLTLDGSVRLEVRPGPAIAVSELWRRAGDATLVRHSAGVSPLPSTPRPWGARLFRRGDRVQHGLRGRPVRAGAARGAALDAADPPWNAIYYGGIVGMILAPLFFYPLSKLCWLAFDMTFRPPRPEDFEA